MRYPVLRSNNKQPSKTLKNTPKSKKAVDLSLTDDEEDTLFSVSENDIGYIRQTFNFTKGDYFDDFSSR